MILEKRFCETLPDGDGAPERDPAPCPPPEAIVAYTLALPVDGGHAATEAHIAACSRCRSEVASLRDALEIAFGGFE